MRWEELRADDFESAREKAFNTCILPFGVIEKHGTHLPLGTDMLTGRHLAVKAAEKEPCVVFPYHCYGQISEARHVPGTVSISPELMYDLLEEVCEEIHRNGFDKIIILNAHGGNTAFLKYFLFSILSRERPYMLYAIAPGTSFSNELHEIFGTDDLGSHGGKKETAHIMAIRPDLVDMETVDDESLEVSDQLTHLKQLKIATPFDWYSVYPTHFAGNPYGVDQETGRKSLSYLISKTAEQIKAIKNDAVYARLKQQFDSKTGD